MRRQRVPNLAPAMKLQMTSMIDIVFLLLVFFVMTFKVIIPEGDFQIHMAADGSGPGSVEQPPEKIRVRLLAGEDGTLAGIQAEGQSLASLEELRQLVMRLSFHPNRPTTVGEAFGPEIEIDADAGLDYRYLMAAMTAVKGYIGSRGEIVQLVDRIKLLPQNEGQL